MWVASYTRVPQKCMLLYSVAACVRPTNFRGTFEPGGGCSCERTAKFREFSFLQVGKLNWQPSWSASFAPSTDEFIAVDSGATHPASKSAQVQCHTVALNLNPWLG